MWRASCLTIHKTNTFNDNVEGCPAGIHHTLPVEHRETTSSYSHIITLSICPQADGCCLQRLDFPEETVSSQCTSWHSLTHSRMHTQAHGDENGLQFIAIVTCGLEIDAVHSHCGLLREWDVVGPSTQYFIECPRAMTLTLVPYFVRTCMSALVNLCDILEKKCLSNVACQK